jgi:hypothetical protein
MTKITTKVRPTLTSLAGLFSPVNFEYKSIVAIVDAEFNMDARELMTAPHRAAKTNQEISGKGLIRLRTRTGKARS